MAMATTAERGPATPEEIWEILRSTAEQQRENERRWQEEIALREREDAKRSEEAKRREEEEARKWAELREAIAETGRQIDKNNKKLGSVENTFGEIVEHLVVPGIEERFEDMGFNFEKASPNARISEGRNTIAEVDVLLENRDCLMAVEVKAKPHVNDVKAHEKRLDALRAWHDRNNDRRKLLGAMAGATFGTEEREAALAAGFFVIVQSGDTMKMEVPSGFVPREW